ncbi:MAG TPA: radical SAM protein [Phycisphaerae bacterium]|nr:radical SAM protein [Phycisphaerae bacterium]
MKNVVLIEPKSPDWHVFSRWKLPRLGLVVLGTRLKAAGYDVKLFVEDVAPVDFAALFSADLVGISTITSTAPRAYEFAKAAKRAGIPVVMGGPHVTFLPDEALEHCDYVIRGEADDLIVDFVKRLESGADLTTMPSLSWRPNGEVVHNAACPACSDVEALPIPDLALIHGYDLSPGSKAVVPVQTSRGCPFDCTFCSVTKMFGRAYRFRSTENVMAELRALRGRYVFFYDDNFTANLKRAKDLMRAMIREGLNLKWSAQVRCDAGRDPELLDLMVRSGCYYVYIGLESVSPAVLESYHKRQSVDEIKRVVREFDRRGIRIHGMFIFGADEDTTETVRETARFARKHHLASAQFAILVPLPGTPVFETLKREGRLLTRDWSRYDGHHVVFRPKRMSTLELQVETLRAFGAFYSLSAALRRLARFDWFTLAIKLWGRYHARRFMKRMDGFVEVTRQWAHETGHKAELRARRTADDIKLAVARFDLDALRRRRQEQSS